MIPALEFVPLLLKPAEKGDRKENKQKKRTKKIANYIWRLRNLSDTYLSFALLMDMESYIHLAWTRVPWSQVCLLSSPLEKPRYNLMPREATVNWEGPDQQPQVWNRREKFTWFCSRPPHTWCQLLEEQCKCQLWSAPVSGTVPQLLERDKKRESHNMEDG